MNKKYDSVVALMVSKYGKGIDKIHVYDKTWYDKNAGLVLTLWKVKESPRPAISFAIVDQRFTQIVSLLQ